jgi:riboflavin-specific deaminase-like protein
LLEAKANGTPLIIAQLGQSLDGRIATPTGSSRGINGPAAMAHLHQLRALVDAVVIGAGTARTDNPQLTVRHCQGESPTRVVIDPRGTVCPSAQVWCSNDGARRIVFGGNDALDASVERLDTPGGQLDPAWILAKLRAEGLSRILIEGGGTTVSHFLAAGVLDLLHVSVAPVVLGSGLTGLALPGVSEVAKAPRPAAAIHIFEGGDVLFACDLRTA